MRIYDKANDCCIDVIPTRYTLQKMLNKIPTKSLVFRHAHIAITDYELGDNPEFEKCLSVFDEVNWKYRRVVGHYIPELKEFRVPRSFDTSILQKYFPNHKPYVENDAYPSDKIDIKLLTEPRDDEQRVSISFLCAQGDFKKNYRYTTLMLDNYMGTGKTYMLAAGCCFLQAKTVIILPISKLIEQWKASFLNFTNVKEDEILVVRGSDKCLEVLDGKHTDKKVFIFMTDTIMSFLDRYGNLSTIEMLRNTRAYLKIVDEVHRDFRAVSVIDALSNFHMNYYSSATPERSQKKERWLFKTVYKNCPRFGSKFKTSDEKWTNIIIAQYRFTPTAEQIKRMVHPRKKWLNSKAYEKELINAPEQQLSGFIQTFESMMRWSQKQLKKGNKILILCGTVDGTAFMQNLTKKFYPDASRYYASMKTADKEKALESSCVCATSQSLGTGADIKGIQHVYNITTYSNSIDAGQMPGRARKINDTQVFYIEMVNVSYIKTFRQFEERKKTLIKNTKTGKLMVVSPD